MHMFRHHPKPPAQRLFVKGDDSAAEAATLRPLIENLNDIVTSLWPQARELRDQLVIERGQSAVEGIDLAEEPPVQPLAVGNDTSAEEIAALHRMVDELNEAADYLWFATQWLEAQLAVARGEFTRNGPV